MEYSKSQAIHRQYMSGKLQGSVLQAFYVFGNFMYIFTFFRTNGALTVIIEKNANGFMNLPEEAELRDAMAKCCTW